MAGRNWRTCSVMNGAAKPARPLYWTVTFIVNGSDIWLEFP